MSNTINHKKCRKTVLIPGASRPIGRAIARRFAREGYSLLLPVFDWPESIAEMKDEFGNSTYDATIFPCDLRNAEEVGRMTEQIAQTGYALSVLVNNIERGGMPVVHGAYSLPHNAGQWELEFATTVTAKMLLYTHTLPLLRKNGQAAVVNISSIAGCTGRSGPVAPVFSDGYSAANRAIRSFTETWARECAPDIRVNELQLGIISSRHGEGTRGWQALTQAEKNAISDRIMLKRQGSPEEVADAVYFLAVEARYMTGAVLRMDGGYLLGDASVPEIPKGILGE